MKKWVILVLLLVLIVAFTGAQEIRYAYKVVQIIPAELQRSLDSYGADGYRVSYMLFMQSYFLVVLEHPY
ncbi:MAG: hypothetical protein Q8O15_07630 [Rectinemataceae bacterium]|nr:hypothetical protein [Rectinemataceae bacterium]